MSSTVEPELIPTIPKRRRGPPPSLRLPTITEALPHLLRRSLLIPILPSLFISGYNTAKDFEALNTAGITHILNLVGETKCPNLFLDKFTYSSLMLPDSPGVDILFFLYFAFEFISNAIENGGKVLVHCMRGTSRAPTIACAFIMHKENISLDEAFRRIKSLHPEADPNLGFICQLRSLDNPESIRKVYSYSSKYDMFTNEDDVNGLCLVLENGDLFLTIKDRHEERERHIGELCKSLWEKVNRRQGHINNVMMV